MLSGNAACVKLDTRDNDRVDPFETSRADSLLAVRVLGDTSYMFSEGE